ncbi:hypothetical protein [Natronorubrum halophilum]|uniref:hypothetical protein n=1 Tax=Natronorubrum halophilum TaxID=1702106 RepID=UPI0010C22987|nr:hypothetical protein [Natronorubrum halophilum]
MAQESSTADRTESSTSERNTVLTRRSYVQSIIAGAATRLGITAGGVTKVGMTVVGALTAEEYEVLKADGQMVRIGEGETFENTLIDLTRGRSFTLVVNGGGSVIRNIGFKGLCRGSGFQILVTASSGEVIVENLYLGDGATKKGSGHEYGPGAIFCNNEGDSDVTFRYCNVQGYPNSGFYCSDTGDSGSVTFENCYGKNNGVATFHCAGPDDSLRNCVGYNDDTDYGPGYDGFTERNGYPVWVGSSGPVTIENSHFAAGAYPETLRTHGDGSIDFESGSYSGTFRGAVRTGTVATDPNLSIPEGVPKSAEEAAIEST